MCIDQFINLAAEKKYADDPTFRIFRRQLFHTSIARILSSLQPAMSTPEVVMCADGLYRHVVYGLSLYIANYPEQVLISGVVQGWCPRYSSTTALLELLTLVSLWHCRCILHKNDLKIPGVPRLKEHMDSIQEVIGLGDLWSLYGVVGKVVVRSWL